MSGGHGSAAAGRVRIGGLVVPLPTAPAAAGARAAGVVRVRTMTALDGHRRRLATCDGRVLWVEESDGARTRYERDVDGRLVARVDALGRATRWRYDDAGRLAAATRPGRGTVVFRHDDSGRPVGQRWAGGESLAIEAAEAAPQGLRFGADDRVRLSHDSAGRLVAAEEEGLETRWRLDGEGRPVEVVRRFGELSFTVRCAEDGAATALALPGGACLDLSPAPPPAGAARFDEPFALDAMGRVVARGGERFAYDARGQLAAWEGGDASVEYGYDAAGNRTRRRGPEGETRYAYGEGDELLAVERPGGRRERLAYDGNGALVGRQGGGSDWRYAYDGRRRLAAVHRDSRQVASYRHDLSGRRVARTDERGTVLYHHDTAGRLVAVTDAAGAPRLTLAWEEEATTARLFDGAGGSRRLTLLRDRQGSTRRILDEAGATVWEGRYSPFGRLLGPPPPFEVPLYAGKLLDPATGLYDFGARDYDPERGRFVTPDPWTAGPDDPRVAAAGGAPPPAWLAEPRAAHPYLYCLNDPLSLSDPQGLGWVRALFANLLAFVWSLPWTLLGFGLTLVDWAFQYPLLGFLYLPSYGLRGAASGRIGSAAMLNVGGLLNANLVLANVLFGRRGFFDQLDDTRQEYVVPELARPNPAGRELRTADTAYREHLVVHTVQSNFAGPFWPLVYAFGHDFFERWAVRESGFTRLAEPTLTLGPEELLSDEGAQLIVVGGQRPLSATVVPAGAGMVGAFTDNPQFSEAHFAPEYRPGKVEIRVADARGFTDTRELEIAEIEVGVSLARPATIFLDEITDSRPVGVDEPQRPTLRLIDRQAATLAFDVEPDGAAVVYESDPVAALTLSRTASKGDAEVTVTPAMAPAAPAAGAHGIEDSTLVVRAWNARGGILRRVRVRSMATIRVVLQAHVVRRDDGTDPAIDAAKMTDFLNTANSIWRQAGLQFAWRPSIDFIDQTVLLVIPGTVTPGAGGGVKIESKELTALQTFNPDPAHPRPTPATDTAALHVYFVNGISLTGGTSIEAFANQGLGRLVLPVSSRLATFAHEIGHLLGLQHPDEESPPARDSKVRLMHSTADQTPHLIGNREPRRTCAADASGNSYCQDETAHARRIATSRTGP